MGEDTSFSEDETDSLEPALKAALRERKGPDGLISWPDFVDVCLYEENLGYYRRELARVGRDRERDFYTASSLGPVFGHLLTAAAARMLGQPDLAGYHLIELGAEPGSGLFETVTAGAGASSVLRLGDDLSPLEGPCVVVANELLDAQPFYRVRFRDGAWREMGVRLNDDGVLLEEECPQVNKRLRKVLGAAPGAPLEGYRLDLPLAAVDLIADLADRPWWGAAIFCDYGRSWEELAEALPEGTARAYYRHSLESNLLARPSRQDLTCHVCWDWLENALVGAGFEMVQTRRQEAFLVQEASAALEALMSGNASAMDHDRRAVAELLHPARMGHKFQVLSAVRHQHAHLGG